MKRLFSALLIGLFLLSNNSVMAVEGMWLPILLKKINANEMQAMGMKITPEEIYSMKQSSLKDAIVHFAGGCTAELVSSQGLLLTNHHCGYRAIQKHSSIDHDYLTDGFWAKTMNDELPNANLLAKIMTNMVDVTEQTLKGIEDGMSVDQRNTIIKANINALKKEYDHSKFNEVSVKAFYYGNQYILMTYSVFHDVRLVGAPPSNIGKFGGDTDNWMWPRHTGDFSVFRIYANAENGAAEYAKDNIPYKPKKHLKISLGGVEPGDFTFVFGYPGRTEEYLPSYALEMITEKVNPFRIKLRREKLDIMGAAMETDPAIRIQYSAKYAGVANGWKKWIGENKGIKRMNAVQTKQKEEQEFENWIQQNENENSIALIQEFKNEYAAITDWEMAYQYFVEAGYRQDLIRYSWSCSKIENLSKSKSPDTDLINKEIAKVKKSIAGFYKDYNFEVDKKLFHASVSAYYDFPYNAPTPIIFDDVIKKKFKGNIDKYVDYVYAKSIFSDSTRLSAFLNNYKASSWKKLANDPLYAYAISVRNNYANSIQMTYLSHSNKIDSLQQIYMRLLIKKNEGNILYPDANSTLRISYGKVDTYEPRDGVKYKHFTTLKGIMDKENPNIYDYVVEPKLKQIYNEKDYDRYSDKDGTMHVCFIASNHTTGGNSGSPVLNADGNLIGLNFDRNWEGTMSDLKYDPDQCRNITLDIRYCLLIIDKFAGATRLIDEMEIVN